MFPQGNLGVRKRHVLLENLFTVRIGSRDPGPHNPVKQRLAGTSGEPSAFSGFSALATATHFLSVLACFLGFGSLLLTVFRSFIPFCNGYNRVEECHYLKAFGHYILSPLLP
jgi:hypothetical protein